MGRARRVEGTATQARTSCRTIIVIRPSLASTVYLPSSMYPIALQKEGSLGGVKVDRFNGQLQRVEAGKSNF